MRAFVVAAPLLRLASARALAQPPRRQRPCRPRRRRSAMQAARAPSATRARGRRGAGPVGPSRAAAEGARARERRRSCSTGAPNWRAAAFMAASAADAAGGRLRMDLDCGGSGAPRAARGDGRAARAGPRAEPRPAVVRSVRFAMVADAERRTPCSRSARIRRRDTRRARVSEERRPEQRAAATHPARLDVAAATLKTHPREPS